jgi:uncharacterized protein (DUF1697 family)
MTIYIALLRGINVGRNMLKMEQLRKILAEAGLSDIKTYLQSGNVVLGAHGAAAELAALIESKVSAVTRLPVSVLLRTPAQMQRVIAGNPFAKEAAALPRTVHVTFLTGAASNAGLAAIGKLQAGADRWQAAGSEIYLHCPKRVRTQQARQYRARTGARHAGHHPQLEHRDGASCHGWVAGGLGRMTRGDLTQARGKRLSMHWVCPGPSPGAFAGVYARASAATPGSSRPSSHSRKAPPAVET